MASSDSLDEIGETGSLFSPEFDVDSSGNADFHSNKGVNLATPTASTDAATKGYVDTKVSTLTSKVFTDSPYSILTTDTIVVVDATSGAVTATLPTAVGVTGKTYVIKKTDSTNNVTVATTSGQTIDGVTTRILSAQYDSLTLVSNGSNWIRI